MIDEDYQQVEMKGSYVPEPAYELNQSLSTIVEVDEMEVDDEEEDEEEEDFAPLQRTMSHRPGSPVEDADDDEEEEDVSEDDSDDELPSPPPQYQASPDHPLINLFEVREKARREELSNHYKIEHDDPSNMFLMNNSLAVAA